MKRLLAMPASEVEEATRGAFREGLSDAERIRSLDSLPGFGGGGAFTSVLLTTWDPARFGVFDRLVRANRHLAVSAICTCDWSDLPTYWTHLCAIADELTSTPMAADVAWAPRRVEMALMNLRS